MAFPPAPTIGLGAPGARAKWTKSVLRTTVRSMANPAAIEPVRRSFAVLEALSRRRTSTLSVLVAETGLPRPTVVRLLHTLMALGYAQPLSRLQAYRLTARALVPSGR